MQQTLGIATNFYEHSKRLNSANYTFVDLVNLGDEANSAHNFFGAPHSVRVNSANFYAATVSHFFNGNGCSRFCLNALNDFTAGSDDTSNKVLWNLKTNHFRSVSLQLNTHCRNGL